MLWEGGWGVGGSHVISAMGLVHSPNKTLHQPPLGIINNLGGHRKTRNTKPTFDTTSYLYSELSIDSTASNPLMPDGLSAVFSLGFDKVSPIANHSLWHSKMKYSSCMPWLACLAFLNIQICARCRPNFISVSPPPPETVTQSPDEIFRSLPRVTQISTRRRQNFCPRFYGRDLNIDQTFAPADAKPNWTVKCSQSM